MSVPGKKRWGVTASSGDPRLAIDDRYATTWISEPSKKPWLEIDLGEISDARRTRGLLGRAGVGKLWIRILAGRQGVDASLPHAPRRRRTGRLRLPARRGALRSLDLRGSATGAARAGDRRNQSLRARRGRLGAGEGAPRRARPCPGQCARGREHHGRFRLCALSARRVDRVGRDVRNRLLGASLRRRRELPGSGPHRDRRRRQRQLLVALHDQPLSSPDGARGEFARRRGRQRTEAAHPQQGSHADRTTGAGGAGRARRPLSAVAAGAASLLDRAGGVRSGRGGAVRRIRRSRAAARIRHRSRRCFGWAALLHGAPASADISQSLAEGSLPIPTVAWSAQDVELAHDRLRPCRSGAGGVPRRQPKRRDAERRARSWRAPGPDQSLLAARRPRDDQRDRGRRPAAVGQRRLYAAFSREPDA